MGKRPFNTTKGGKFMNPTDQARKEARKRELKKNKKQRQMVRTAVLKGKDPKVMLLELEKLDEMEYDPMNLPVLGEKVLKEKRRKVQETLDRVMRLYQREDPELYAEMKTCQIDYEKKRKEKQAYFEAVREAQRVTVDAIPMPDGPLGLGGDDGGALPADIPLPAPVDPAASGGGGGGGGKGGSTVAPFSLKIQAKPATGILKPSNALKSSLPAEIIAKKRKNPPGPPPGPPPPLSDDEDEPSAAAKAAAAAAKAADPAQRALIVAMEREKRLREAEEMVLQQGLVDPNAVMMQRRIRFSDESAGISAQQLDPLAAAMDAVAQGTTPAILKPKAPAPVTNLQMLMLSMAGQPAPDPAKRAKPAPMVEKTTTTPVLATNLVGVGDIIMPPGTGSDAAAASQAQPPTQPPQGIRPPGLMPPGPPPGLPPNAALLYRGHPGAPPGGPPGGPPPRLMPPGPPPGRPPMGMPPGPPPGLPPPGLPRGLPPGRYPPGMLVRQFGSVVAPPAAQTGVLSAAPRLVKTAPSDADKDDDDVIETPAAPGTVPIAGTAAATKKKPAQQQQQPLPQQVSKKTGATIVATPQIRKVNPDVTRFMPTSLKVKRAAGAAPSSKGKRGEEEVAAEVPTRPTPAMKSKNKDAAYDDFMKEIEGLL